MRKKHFSAFVPLSLFAVVVALVSVPLLRGKDPSVLPSALLNRPVPAFTLPPAVEGLPGFSQEDLRSKPGPSLVNVFSSWCMTCLAEQPVLEEISRDGKIPVYAIDYKDNRNDVARWLSRHGNPFLAIGFDEDGRAAIDWGVYGVPETFVVDRNGIIRYKHVGAISKEDYKNKIAPLLAELGK